ncbi:MAG: hypothetical protein HY606_15270, partial [Planctomycetes bacterium]|nr:hypothetical protein [Planctomycetota bacterium]
MGNTSIGGEGGNFPQTVWKVILSAKNRQSACYKDNLNYLISRYWKPVYIHIRLKWGKSNEDAKDLTQEFFTQFLIKNMLESARPGLGLFRTYVKKLLRNFLIDNSRAESRQKRGGGQRKISLSSVREDEVKFTGEPDNFDVFDKEWAKCVIDNSLKRLESYLHQGNKPAYYKIFYLYD